MKNTRIFFSLPILFFILSFCCSCEKDDPDTEDDIKTQTVEYTGGSFKMVYCPGGTFLTNDDDDDLDFEDGLEVTVDPFWISEIEVTNELLAWIYNCASGIEFFPGVITGGTPIFDTEDDNAPNYLCEDYVKWGDQPLIYMGDAPLNSYYDIELNNGFNPRDDRDDYPCTDVTWYGAIMACNWLSDKGVGLGQLSNVYTDIDDEEWWANETVSNTNKTGFRLATSDEWECAARWQGTDSSGDCYEYPAGSGQYWTGGGCASGATALASDVVSTSDVAVYRYNDASIENPDDVHEVIGNRKANALGLYDMSGNVWEWCYDEAGSWQNRILRGGGAFSNYHDVRIISSTWNSADGTASDLGFRLVMSAGAK